MRQMLPTLSFSRFEVRDGSKYLGAHQVICDYR